MKKTYIAPKNWVVQLNLSENVANLIVTSNGYNSEDAWTNKKDYTYEDESEFLWDNQE
ncbi:MAG: hypothetical protein MSS61_08360 [Bacteroidales bacterium]|nr:hypothetical protein [Bacteroidales bacterium]